MVQKESSRAGRPPAFDRAEVLAAAQRAFFRSGFQATTLPELEAATGVDRSTLYNSFGGKSGVYEAAVAAYLANARERLFWPVREGALGLADITAFLDRFEMGLTRPEAPRGCLVVNDMAAEVGREAGGTYLAMVEEAFSAALARAALRGEIADEGVPGRARLLTLGVLATNLLAKSQADDELLRSSIDALRHQVAHWRVAPPSGEQT